MPAAVGCLIVLLLKGGDWNARVSIYTAFRLKGTCACECRETIYKLQLVNSNDENCAEDFMPDDGTNKLKINLTRLGNEKLNGSLNA